MAGAKKNKPQNSRAMSKGKKKAIVENMPRIEPNRKLLSDWLGCSGVVGGCVLIDSVCKSGTGHGMHIGHCSYGCSVFVNMASSGWCCGLVRLYENTLTRVLYFIARRRRRTGLSFIIVSYRIVSALWSKLVASMPTSIYVIE